MKNKSKGVSKLAKDRLIIEKIDKGFSGYIEFEGIKINKIDSTLCIWWVDLYYVPKNKIINPESLFSYLKCALDIITISGGYKSTVNIFNNLVGLLKPTALSLKVYTVIDNDDETEMIYTIKLGM